ncbi:MAG: hypothetical protein M1823_003472 [Watsoniomyces obsoletus]|nr:MAG: hypothetical protein M1823_003472 [Watsoniomyces obsoletus]
MGLGVLEDRRMEHVPGTVHVLDEASTVAHHHVQKPGVKYDTSGSTPVVLVPQPSNDPNDPLNWPLWKRDVIIVILSIASIMAAALSPILAANTLTLSFYFRRDFTAIALLTGYHLCGVGVAGVLIVTSARVWGKRHLYLLGTAILVWSSVWAGLSTSYKSFLWARIIQGVGVAPFESLVNASVGDMYFVHQRGIRMALANVSLFGSAFFTPILVGKITATLGWPWTFYLVAIFSAVSFLLIFFFVPETTYVRPAYLNTDIVSVNPGHQQEGQAMETSNGHHPPNQDYQQQYPMTALQGNSEQEPESNSFAGRKDSYLRSLLCFNGRKTHENFFKLLLRPLMLFLHPAVIWACLIQGALIGWTVVIGVVLAAIFLGPPLFFDEVQTGYMYTGAFIGALLGFIVAGVAADWSARVMTRRNNGIYEPEFRLVLILPVLVFGCGGLYGFGITSNNVVKYGWFWPDFFFGLEVMGMVIGAVLAALYIVDAHRDISVEAFTTLLIFKNMFSFALTWGAYDWIVQNGILKTFNILASVQVVVCLLCIPMYVLGKRNRSFFHRHDILKMTGLR